MTSARLIVALCLPLALAAQTTSPEITDCNRYADGSCNGVLQDEIGEVPFHLAVTAYRTDLWIGSKRLGQTGGKLLPKGSEEERAFVARLLSWSRVAFDEKERSRIEQADDVHHRGSDWSFARYKQAAVVNRLAQYRRIRDARITDVFAGRGTVKLSFKVRDGLGKQQLVLFRKINGAIYKPHLGNATEPVAIGSIDERWIVQAMHAYSEAGLDKQLVDLLWSGGATWPQHVDQNAVKVLTTLIGYRNQTSPRLVNVFYVKDGGSLAVALANARGNQYEVWFDKAIDSTTIGRMIYEAEQAGSSSMLRAMFVGGPASPRRACDRTLVEFGSHRERQLLAGFDTLLKRHAEQLEADGHNDLKEIQERLAIYRDLAADNKRRQP